MWFFSDLVADQFNLTLFSKNVLHTAVSLVYCKNMYTPQFHFSAAKCRMKLTENDLLMLFKWYFAPRCRRKLLKMSKTPQFLSQSSPVLIKMAHFRIDSESLSWQKVYFEGFQQRCNFLEQISCQLCRLVYLLLAGDFWWLIRSS